MLDYFNLMAQCRESRPRLIHWRASGRIVILAAIASSVSFIL